MKTTPFLISSRRIKRIREQGYFNYTASDISALAFGNRFAFILCTSIMIIGILTANVPLLTALALIAFGGVVLPNHPFDYIYNGWLRHQLNKAELPPRSPQLKFACGMATMFLLLTAYLFNAGYTIAAYAVGAQLVVVAGLVSTLDYCIPSKIYNFLFKKD